jgi:hypothetical protein
MALIFGGFNGFLSAGMRGAFRSGMKILMFGRIARVLILSFAPRLQTTCPRHRASISLEITVGPRRGSDLSVWNAARITWLWGADRPDYCFASTTCICRVIILIR